MKTKYLLTWLLPFFWCWGLKAQPHLKRICASQSGTNTLSWNTFTNPLCNQPALIIIYARKDKQSPYTKIDSVPQDQYSSYEHRNAISYLRGSYFLEYKYPCANSRIYYSDTLDVDVFAPDILQPDSVSVSPDGKVYIGWEPERAPDTKSYIVYRTLNNNNYPIDTMLGKATTFLIDSMAGKPEAGPEKYKLAPVDSCNNIAPIGNYHQTIFLTTSADSCKGLIYLSWTPYIGWSGIDHYEIWASRNDEDHFTRIGSESGNAFTWAGAVSNSTYYFFVRAFKAGNTAFTSTSNRVNRFANFSIPLKWVYIPSVTVEDGHCKIYFAASRRTDVAYYKIYRSTLNDNRLDYYATVQASGGVLDSFTDHGTDPVNHVYYYRVDAYNGCDNILGSSQVSNSIQLKISADGNNIHLFWNDYKRWIGGADHYVLYRTMDGKKWVAVNTGSDIAFTDTDTFGEYSREGVCYRVQAFEGANDSLGYHEFSISDQVCHIDPPLVWIPNIFNPYSATEANTVFKPIILHVDTLQSSMRIYNRWGEEVYNTNNITRGWDGRYKGKISPSGVFMYIIETTGYNHSHKVYKGTVTLLD